MDHARAPAFDFGALFSTFVISVTAFLTVVDLFATQAILPALAARYGVAPAAMGVAVNATTLGMALSGLGVALFSARIDRRAGKHGSGATRSSDVRPTWTFPSLAVLADALGA